MNGSGRSVAERWESCWQALSNEEPSGVVFRDRTSRTCKARYDKIVDDQSKSDGQAQRDSGAGTADSGSEDEGVKKTKAELVRGVEPLIYLYLFCRAQARLYTIMTSLIKMDTDVCTRRIHKVS